MEPLGPFLVTRSLAFPALAQKLHDAVSGLSGSLWLCFHLKLGAGRQGSKGETWRPQQTALAGGLCGWFPFRSLGDAGP